MPVALARSGVSASDVSELWSALELLAKRMDRAERRLPRPAQISMMSNLLVGVWVFLSRYEVYIRRSNRTRGWASKFLPPSLKPSDSFSAVVFEGYVHALLRSFPFFISAYLLTRPQRWKRSLAYWLAATVSLYFGLFSKVAPWCFHFNFFITVALNSSRITKWIGGLL
eukprot:tig00020610_g12051.t1